jgi:hypothetical protein
VAVYYCRAFRLNRSVKADLIVSMKLHKRGDGVGIRLRRFNELEIMREKLFGGCLEDWQGSEN